MIIGYTTGVFDLFHIGHLNLLKNAKGMCDKLIVGVTTDELVSYKGKQAFIPFTDRIEIIRSCKYVDAAVPQYDMDTLRSCSSVTIGTQPTSGKPMRRNSRRKESGSSISRIPRVFPPQRLRRRFTTPEAGPVKRPRIF